MITQTINKIILFWIKTYDLFYRISDIQNNIIMYGDFIRIVIANKIITIFGHNRKIMHKCHQLLAISDSSL